MGPGYLPLHTGADAVTPNHNRYSPGGHLGQFALTTLTIEVSDVLRYLCTAFADGIYTPLTETKGFLHIPAIKQ